MGEQKWTPSVACVLYLHLACWHQKFGKNILLNSKDDLENIFRHHMHFWCKSCFKKREHNYPAFKDTFPGTNSQALLLANFVEKPIRECIENKIEYDQISDYIPSCDAKEESTKLVSTRNTT